MDPNEKLHGDWVEIWNRDTGESILEFSDGGVNIKSESVMRRCIIKSETTRYSNHANCLCLQFNSEGASYYPEIDCVTVLGDDLNSDLLNPFATESSVDFLASSVQKLDIRIEDKEKGHGDIALKGYGFLSLPDEIVLKIFGYISITDMARISRTCSRLYPIANDYSLYKRLDLRSLFLSLTDNVLMCFTRKCRIHNWNIKSISVEWGFRVSATSIESLVLSCSNLRCLNLANVNIATLSNLNFTKIANFCPNLESIILRLNHQKFRQAAKTLESFRDLRLFSLESADIEESQFKFFRDWICTNKFLTFLSLDSLTPTLMSDQTNLLLDLLVQNCPNLQCLNICRAAVNDQSFIHMSAMPSLKALDVGWSYRQETGSLEYNSALCQMLNSKRSHFTSLIFTACRGFNVDALACIAKTQSILKCLDILGVVSLAQGYRSLELVFKSCKQLQYVDLSYVKGISDREVAVLVALYPSVDIKRAHTSKADEEFYQNLLLNPRYGLNDS